GIFLSPRWHFQAAAKIVPVPPTLMLHSKNRWKLSNVLKWLVDNGYTGITYRQFASVLLGELTLPDKPVILSLDDLDTVYINPAFLSMTDEMEKSGFRGVLGIIASRTPSENAASWKSLNDLAARGWEIDTHTLHHALLPPLKRDDLHAEIVDSANMIADAVNVAPTTLIVPYANIKSIKGKVDERIFQFSNEATLEFVVGMAGGRHLETSAMPPYYVGRIPIGTDAVQTGNWILDFHREPDDAETE